MSDAKLRPARHRNCYRLFAALVSISLVAGMGQSPIDATEAAWTDNEYASTDVTAGVLPQPDPLLCSERSLLGLGLGSAVDLDWPSVYGADGYWLEGRVEGQNQWIAVSAPLKGTSATFENGLLEGLLGGLLSNLLGSDDGTIEVRVKAVSGRDWESHPTNSVRVEKRTLRVLLALISSFKCV